MNRLDTALTRFVHSLEHLEARTRKWFVTAALLAYAGSLVWLTREVSPVSQLDAFLVKALAHLSIPFSIILLQELFELVITISQSTLRSTCQQFEIVALVILRSFFKDFYKLNQAVASGEYGEPVAKALVKAAAILLITVLIFIFKRLSDRAGMERRDRGRRAANQWKQMAVLALCLGVFMNMAPAWRSFEIMRFISLVFTGMIVVDAVFFLWTMLKNHEFDSLMFDGGLVVGLIFARFPLFASNILSYLLAVVGVAFATAALRMFVRPPEIELLGNPAEDEVSRLDVTIGNRTSELAALNEKMAVFLKQFQVPEDTAKRIRLACEELLRNVISYAYEDDKPHEVEIGFALFDKRLAITVSDDGRPFNPFREEPPDTQASIENRELGGLGIHLVRNVMSKVTYGRHAGRNVVALLMELKHEDET